MSVSLAHLAVLHTDRKPKATSLKQSPGPILPVVGLFPQRPDHTSQSHHDPSPNLFTDFSPRCNAKNHTGVKTYCANKTYNAWRSKFCPLHLPAQLPVPPHPYMYRRHSFPASAPSKHFPDHCLGSSLVSTWLRPSTPSCLTWACNKRYLHHPWPCVCFYTG